MEKRNEKENNILLRNETKESETRSHLQTLFQLKTNKDLFTQATTPESCGGSDAFKYLALLGDKLLDFSLFELLSDGQPMPTGELTKAMQAIHNERTLSSLGYRLQLHSVMHPMDHNHLITKNEVKEAIEALLGASYRQNDIQTIAKIVEHLLEYLTHVALDAGLERQLDGETLFQASLLDSNYVSDLLELFQQKGLVLPDFTYSDNEGLPHAPKFSCTCSGLYGYGEHDEIITVKSAVYATKKDAKRDAAQRFLVAIGARSSLYQEESILATENASTNTTVTEAVATKALHEERIVFTSGPRKDTYDKMQLDTGTGEKLLDWAYNKMEKKPFSMLLLLSARVAEVSGASWLASLDQGHLALLNVKLEDAMYFAVGFGVSRSRARKAAARTIIQKSKLLEWLAIQHASTVI